MSYAPTPAEDNLFDIKYNDAVLDEKNRSKFHTIVAKLLYASKHIGVVIMAGDAFVCGYSRKQRVNTKSSCEAELVGVSDGINPGLGCRNFLVQQGYARNPMLLFQECQSTIKMIQGGISNLEKSRHFDIRF